MKKFISACLFALALFATVATYAQQNITFVVKGKKETSDKSVMYLYLKGFTDQKQAEVLYDKMRALPDISGVQNMGKDPDGIYMAVAKLKTERPTMSRIEMAEKVGITHVEKDGKTMTLQEWKKSKERVNRSGHTDETK
jgi:hypothetical protein